MTASDFKHTMKALRDFGKFIVTNYKSQLEAEHMNNGELYKTISYKVTTETGGWVVTISLADYWKNIEDGRKPSRKKPPVDVIENWIKVRGILPRPVTLKSGKTVVPTIRQLAFAIATDINKVERKNGKRGIPPKPLFKNSFEAAKQQFIQVIKDAIVQDIKESLV